MDDGYDPHNVMSLLYNIEMNRFEDASFGNIIHNIYDYLQPWQIFLFKKTKRHMVFPDVTNSFLIELLYPACSGWDDLF